MQELTCLLETATMRLAVMAPAFMMFMCSPPLASHSLQRGHRDKQYSVDHWISGSPAVGENGEGVPCWALYAPSEECVGAIDRESIK